MYTSFFGFRAKPFNSKPELRFHYVNPRYAETFNAIRKGIRETQGLFVLTGAAGLGKTLFLQRLISSSNRQQDTKFIVCPNPNLCFEELIDYICQSLELRVRDKSAEEKIQWLKASLEERVQQGKAVVLVIDDAHSIDDAALQALLAAFALPKRDDRTLQLFFLGLAELEKKVRAGSTKLGAVCKAQCYQLLPLSDEEVANYIMQQLRAAGYQGNTIFTPNAIERIMHYSKGSLRSLSVLCDASLVIAYLQSSRQVTVEIVNEAAQQHCLSPQSAEDSAEINVLAAAAEPETPPPSTPKPAVVAAPSQIEPEPLVTSKAAADEDDSDSLTAQLTQLAADKTGEGFLTRHLPMAAGAAALLLCTGLLLMSYLSQDDISPATPQAVVATTPTVAQPVVSANTPSSEPTPVQQSAESGPVQTVTAQGAQLAMVAKPQTDSTNSVIEPSTQQPDPVLPSTIPALGSDPGPRQPSLSVEQLLTRASEQLQEHNLLGPAGNNALETYLQVLRVVPGQKTALDGLRKLNKHYFEQAETAQKAKQSLLHQAEQVRQEQQQYLDQLELAKAEKERYLKELSDYYISQAILANQYKIDSLIQAERAKQTTREYLNQLAGVIRKDQQRPSQARSGLAWSQQPDEWQQQAMLANSRVARLLERARQQMAAKRLMKPVRDSALSTYRQILDLEPGNVPAQEGIERIMAQYLSWAETAALQSNPKQAQRYFDQALSIDPDSINLAQKIREVRQQIMAVQQALSGVRNANTSHPKYDARHLNTTPKLAEALLQSARYGDADNVASLLSSGAAPDVHDMRGDTALIIAAENGHTEVVENLLRRGARINRSNPFGETALMAAARSGQFQIVKLLIDRGASPHSKDSDGHTSLINASINGHVQVVQLLLDKGANPDMRSKSGRTALMVAAWNGQLDVMRLLLRYGVNLDARSHEGWTALSYAAWQGHRDVVALLLDKGADANIKNNDGQTPLTMAYNRGHDAIVQLLQ